MFNRDKQTVTVLTYADTVDAYGQKKNGTPQERTIEMSIKRYTDGFVNNPKYNDVEYIGLTLDKSITDANRLKIGTVIYSIVTVIPSARYYQVLFRLYK